MSQAELSSFTEKEFSKAGSLTWADLGFRIEMTGDGSPTLRLLQGLREDFDEGEAMHHSGGAAEETDLIYGTCAREVFKHIEKPRFLVVGLGLGYIEMFIAKEALLQNRQVAGVMSLESIPELKDFFLRWLNDLPLLPEVRQVYDDALRCVIDENRLQTSATKVSAEAVKNLLKNHFESTFAIEESLHSNFLFAEKFNGIFYDAFSGKTSPELWEEEFLNDFLKKSSAEKSWLATYACRGSLKRALRTQGFEVTLGPGFHGKRKYTQGARNYVRAVVSE